MKVYILFKECNFDFGEAGGIHGVYSSFEKAEDALKEMGKKSSDHDRFWVDIEKWELDAAAEVYRDEHVVT